MRTIVKAIQAIVLALIFASVAQATQQETIAERNARLGAEQSGKPSTPESCDSLADPREKLICLKAQKIELEKAEKEARKELAKLDSPAMRKARAEVEKEERREKRREKQDADTLKNAAITGCNPGDVDVDSHAVSYRTINSFVKIRVTNPEQVAIDIEDAKYGVLVRNLCAGGSMTLFRARKLYDPDYLTFRFIAKARLPNGEVLMDESPTYTLSSSDYRSGRGQQFEEWTIRLRKVYSGTR